MLQSWWPWLAEQVPLSITITWGTCLTTIWTRDLRGSDRGQPPFYCTTLTAPWSASVYGHFLMDPPSSSSQRVRNYDVLMIIKNITFSDFLSPFVFTPPTLAYVFKNNPFTETARMISQSRIGTKPAMKIFVLPLLKVTKQVRRDETPTYSYNE
jgi:hypothetical protein